MLMTSTPKPRPVNFNVSRDKKLNNLNPTNQFQLPLVNISTTPAIALPGSLVYNVPDEGLYISNGNMWNLVGGNSGGSSTTVPTIAALRLTNPITSIEAITVEGYTTPGDGGGGLFFYQSSDTTSPDNGGTIIVSTNGSRWYRIFSGGVNVKWFGATGNGTTDDTGAIQNAISSITNGGEVYFPNGTYSVTAPVATRVSPGQGAAFILVTANSNIIFRGQDRDNTSIVPATNEIEIFAISTASNLTFEYLTFDNSANGILQNQIKPASKAGPNTGIAGLGNSANTVLSQWQGNGGLTVNFCQFLDFNCAISYSGDYLNEAILVGELKVAQCIFNGCAFGVLPAQPETIMISECESIGLVTSINNSVSDPSDPCHLLYVTNRPGAAPYNISVVGCIDRFSDSSCIKIRKGLSVTVSDITTYNSGRGVEVWNCPVATVTNCSIQMGVPASADGDQTGLQITDCGTVTVSNCVVNTIGAAVQYGLRITTDTIPPFGDNYVSVSNITVIYDMNSPQTNTLHPIYIQGQSNGMFDNLRAFHNSSIAGTFNYPITVVGCTGCVFFRPIHWAPFSPTDASHLINIDNTSSNCRVTFTDQDLYVAYSSSTISDNGTNDQIVRLNYGNDNGDVLAGVFGTAANPAFSFYNGYDCGLYRVQAQVLGISANGKESAAFFGNRVNITSGSTAEILQLAGGTSPTVSVTGTDTNINLLLQAQGTGTINCSSSVLTTGYIVSGTLSPGATGFGNGVVLATGGTAAAPGFSFTNAYDCGIYRVQGQVLGVSANGTESAAFFSNKVNIITGSATDYLQLTGGSTPAVAAVGTDTNINLSLAAQGTGTINCSSSVISTGYVQATHHLSSSGPPTVVLGTASNNGGTAATYTVTGVDEGFTFQVTTSSITPAASSAIATFTYATAFPTGSSVVWSPNGAHNTANLTFNTGPYISASSSTGFTWSMFTANLTASTTYQWCFIIKGY